MTPTTSDNANAPATTVMHGSHDHPTVELMGVKFDALTEQQTVACIMDALTDGRGGWVITPNLDHLRRAHRDSLFKVLVAQGTLVVADGMPLIWASRIAGTPLPERVAGSSLVSTVAAAAAEHDRTLFLLGGNEGAADAAAAQLSSSLPNLTIVGTHCPPFGFEKNDTEMNRILIALNETKPDIVYVGLGSPKQEKLIEQLRPMYPDTWWLGIGISLSFLAGEVKRAPAILQKTGLEWIHRMFQEPRRLFRRYLIEGIPFAFRLLFHALNQRFWGSHGPK